MNQLSIVGISFILLGILIQLLPETRYFKWCIQIRTILIGEAEVNGNDQKAKMLRNEINVMDNKLPMFGKIISCAGIICLVMFFFMPKS